MGCEPAEREISCVFTTAMLKWSHKMTPRSSSTIKNEIVNKKNAQVFVVKYSIKLWRNFTTFFRIYYTPGHHHNYSLEIVKTHNYSGECESSSHQFRVTVILKTISGKRLLLELWILHPNLHIHIKSFDSAFIFSSIRKFDNIVKFKALGAYIMKYYCVCLMYILYIYIHDI